MSIGYGFDEDGVRVVVVKHEHVVVTASRLNWEFPCLIQIGPGEHFVVDDGKEYGLCSWIFWFLCWGDIKRSGQGDWFIKNCFGRPNVLLLGFEMALTGG